MHDKFWTSESPQPNVFAFASTFQAKERLQATSPSDARLKLKVEGCKLEGERLKERLPGKIGFATSRFYNSNFDFKRRQEEEQKKNCARNTFVFAEMISSFKVHAFKLQGQRS